MVSEVFKSLRREKDRRVFECFRGIFAHRHSCRKEWKMNLKKSPASARCRINRGDALRSLFDWK